MGRGKPPPARLCARQRRSIRTSLAARIRRYPLNRAPTIFQVPQNIPADENPASPRARETPSGNADTQPPKRIYKGCHKPHRLPQDRSSPKESQRAAAISCAHRQSHAAQPPHFARRAHILRAKSACALRDPAQIPPDIRPRCSARNYNSPRVAATRQTPRHSCPASKDHHPFHSNADSTP